MTENAKNPTAQKTIQDPPEYNVENAKNPKEGFDWLGGPQNGDKTPDEKIEGAYQTASHSTGYTDQLGSADWLGGPQNGNETASGSDFTKHRFNETPGEASKQAPDRSGSQAYTDKLGGSSDN